MKAVAAIALVAIAIAAPYVVPGLIGVAAGSFAAIAVTAAIEVGVSLLSGLVLGQPGAFKNGLQSSPVQRLYAQKDTTAPRKILFGDTAAAADLRYDEYTGSNQETYNQIIAAASHLINGVYQLWIDNEQAMTFSGWSAGVAQGRFASWLTGYQVVCGAPSISTPVGTSWTSSCTLTDCAYLRLSFSLRGTDSNPSPFQGGVSNRLTLRAKGAYLYDPRLDSTVAGGSGGMRAADNTTWSGYGWDSNRCRNPALQLLFYLLGWRSTQVTTGLVMVGMGVPPARIDLASFITAANICDESVALKAGGSEPRYRCDGVVSEGDDRKSVIDALCGTMNGMLRDSGGKISLQILVNDLASPVLDLGADDILGSEDWVQAPALSGYYNVVRGRFVDPSDAALYQLSAYPDQRVASTDAIERIQTVDFPMVQSGTQAQRLAKLRLMRAQFQGRYTATFGPRAWAASIGTIVRLTHPGLNFTNKLFRVVEQRIGRNGQVTMSLLEEDASIYAWTAATDEKAVITPGTPPVTNPTNNPLLPVTDTASILRNSYPKGMRVTASDAGSSATITIDGGSAGAHFTLDYATNPPQDVSVADATITGLAYSTLYYVYCDVDALLDGSPHYGVTGSFSDAVNSAAHPMRIYLNQYVTTPAAGGSSSGGTAGGGGYGGGDPGTCVTVDTPILMANGTLKPAGALQVGDLLRTQHEDTLAWGDHEVVAVRIAADQGLFRAEVDGKVLRGTPDHRVFIGRWAALRDIGEADGRGDVVKLSVADARTYVSNGILSHNIKPV